MAAFAPAEVHYETPDWQNPPHIVNPVWLGPGASAHYSGRSNTPDNGYFSMRRDLHGYLNPDMPGNFANFARIAGFNPGYSVWPHSWPHSGEVVVAEHTQWLYDRRSGGYIPNLPNARMANTYDGIVTQSPNYVLCAQSADCPFCLLHDPVSRTIAAIHCGNKPVGRGVVEQTVAAMVRLGANPANILAYVGPGAGDDVYEFDFFEADREVFRETDREHLLDKFTRELTAENAERLRSVGLKPHTNTTLALNALVRHELEDAGIMAAKITGSPRSSILDPSLPSFRRDNPDYGMLVATIRLVPLSIP